MEAFVLLLRQLGRGLGLGGKLSGRGLLLGGSGHELEEGGDLSEQVSGGVRSERGAVAAT